MTLATTRNRLVTEARIRSWKLAAAELEYFLSRLDYARDRSAFNRKCLMQSRDLARKQSIALDDAITGLARCGMLEAGLDLMAELGELVHDGRVRIAKGKGLSPDLAGSVPCATAILLPVPIPEEK